MATLATCGNARADERTAPAADELGKVVVTGQGARPKSPSQNAKVVDAKALEDTMAHTMEDIVRYVPGVEIVDMGRFGDNGFNIRGMESDRVAMTVDGLALPESIESARNYEFFRSGRGGLDIDTLKSVEIVKGADSITSGSGAMGGAVSFTTKDPRDFLHGSGNAAYGSLKGGYSQSNDERMGTLTLAGRMGRLETMLVYTRRAASETEGWYHDTAIRTGSGRRLPDPVDHDSSNWLAKLQMQATPTQRLGVVFERARTDNLVENLSRVMPPGYLERWGDDHSRRDRYGVSWQWQADSAVFDTVELQADRQKTASFGLTRIVAGSGCPGGGAPCLRTEDRNSHQVLDRISADFTKVLHGRMQHDIVYGLAWQTHSIDFSSIDTRWRRDGSVASVEIDPAQVPETDVRVLSLYGRDRMRFADDRVGVVLGVRYDRYDYRPHTGPTFADPLGVLHALRFSSPSAMVGVDWNFAPHQTLWFQASRAFRAPTVADMYAPIGYSLATDLSTNTQVQYWTSAPNPALGAEHSLALELGWRWRSEHAQLGASVFRDKYDGFIEQTEVLREPDRRYNICSYGRCQVVTGNRYYTPTNLGEATVRGYELEGMVRQGGWSVRGAFSQSRGRTENDRPLDSINPGRGVLGLRWMNPSGSFNISANLIHTLEKKPRDMTLSTDPFTGQVNKRFASPAWTIVDLLAGYQSKHFRVNAGIYNLFDRRYTTWQRIRMTGYGDFALYGYATDYGIGRLTQPGRNARIAITYIF